MGPRGRYASRRCPDAAMMNKYRRARSKMRATGPSWTPCGHVQARVGACGRARGPRGGFLHGTTSVGVLA